MNLEKVIIDTGENPQWSVIWLHGLGADGHDFEPLVPELVQAKWPAIRFIFPHAPIRAVTINNGFKMRAWYDLLSLDFNQKREDEAGVLQSVSACEALIEQEYNRGVPTNQILIAGFSQGGAIALATCLAGKYPLAGCIALSTYLPMAEQTIASATETGIKVPLFMAHGSQDPVVPLFAGSRSRDRLQAIGMDITWRDYPMQHSICAEEITDLRSWMAQILEV